MQDYRFAFIAQLLLARSELFGVCVGGVAIKAETCGCVCGFTPSLGVAFEAQGLLVQDGVGSNPLACVCVGVFCDANLLPAGPGRSGVYYICIAAILGWCVGRRLQPPNRLRPETGCYGVGGGEQCYVCEKACGAVAFVACGYCWLK